MKSVVGLTAILCGAAISVLVACAPLAMVKPALEGKLSVSVNGSGKSAALSRTIAPTVSRYELVLSPNVSDPAYASSANFGAASPYFNQMVSDVAAQINLPTGPWSLTVKSYDLNGSFLKSGAATFMLVQGTNVVPVALSSPVSGVGSFSGSGSLAASYWWPATTVILTVAARAIAMAKGVLPVTNLPGINPTYVTSGNFSLTTYPWDPATGTQYVNQDGTNTPTSAGVVAGVACAIDLATCTAALSAKSLASGSYWLSLTLHNGSAIEANIGELVQIYNGTLSSKTEMLGDFDLTANLANTSVAPSAPVLKILTNSDGYGSVTLNCIKVTEALVDPNILFLRTCNGIPDTGNIYNLSTYDPNTSTYLMSQDWEWYSSKMLTGGDVLEITASNRVGTSATASATYHPIALTTDLAALGGSLQTLATMAATVDGDVSNQGVSWAVDNPSVTTLSNVSTAGCTAAALLAGSAVVTATSIAFPANSVSYSLFVPVVITITSGDPVSLLWNGASFQATATTNTGLPIVWSTSSGGTIAYVDPNTGLVSPVSMGSDTLNATSNGYSASASIVVGS